MDEFLKSVYDFIIPNRNTERERGDREEYRLTGIDTVDTLLSKLIHYYFYFSKSFNFERFYEICVYLIEYSTTLFMIISVIYIVRFLKESLKKLPSFLNNATTAAADSHFYDDISRKSCETIMSQVDFDNLLFIKNKETGEYEKFKLIKVLKGFSSNLNYNENNNNNSNSVSSNSKVEDFLANRFELFDYKCKDDRSTRSCYTQQSCLTLTAESHKTVTQVQSNIENCDEDDGIIKVNSLSMLSHVLISPTSPATSISKPIASSLNDYLKKLNLKRLYLDSKPTSRCCLFTCVAYCLIYVNNEEFWQRYEKKSESQRPNLQHLDARYRFIMKLRRIVYKYWIKNLTKFYTYTLEFDKQSNISESSLKFKNEEQLKAEMKNYINDGYYCMDSLGYTIPCILSVCLQLTIFLLRNDDGGIIKICPSMLGKIEVENLASIYLVQQSNGSYDTAIPNN